MTYHKRPLQTRKCAHCRTKFESNHKSRLYCSQSCNTLAWRARQVPKQAGSAAEQAPQPAGGGPATLGFSAQNVGVLALGAALGTAAVQGTAALWQQATQGGSDLDVLRAEVRQLRQAVQALHPALAPAPPPSVLSGLPTALRTAPAPRVPLQLGPGDPVLAVRVEFHGQVLYHHEGQQLLVWEATPGTYLRLTKAEQLPQLAAYAARQPPKAAPPAPAPPVRAPQPALPTADADALMNQWLAELPAALAREAAENSVRDEQFRAAFQAGFASLPNE